MSTIAMNKQVQRTRAERSRVVAHPKRRTRGAVRGSVASCVVELPDERVEAVPFMRLKVAAVSVVAVIAAIVGGAGYVQAVNDEMAVEGALGQGSWMHVED